MSFGLTVKVLSIHDIMHCVHQTVFIHNARSDTTKFSHLGTDTEKKTNMDTHCTNICSSFTRDPENTQSGLQCQDCNKNDCSGICHILLDQMYLMDPIQTDYEASNTYMFYLDLKSLRERPFIPNSGLIKPSKKIVPNDTYFNSDELLH